MEQELSGEGGGAAKQVTKAPHCEPFTKGQKTVAVGIGGDGHVMEINTALPMATRDELTAMVKSKGKSCLRLGVERGGMMA